MSKTVAYFRPLNLSFCSGQTIQVVRDYLHLSEQGFQVLLYGAPVNGHETGEVYAKLKGSRVRVSSLPLKGHIGRSLSKWPFLARLMLAQTDYVVARDWPRLDWILKRKRLLGAKKVLIELHEDAFPHLLHKDPAIADRYLELGRRLIPQVDGIILTTPAQEALLKRDFPEHAPYAVLPNGVELERWKGAKRAAGNVEHIPITYCGQFTAWKNIDLLFAALQRLPERFVLRIAGGKGDAGSTATIRRLATKYQVDHRIDWRGFVNPDRLVREVISGSGVLALPLGTGIMAEHLTSPMKLIEYMATPIPVVAVNAPSTQALAGDDCVWMSSRDPDDFASAIKNAASAAVGEPRLKKMRRRAEDYDYRVRAKRYADFLTSL